MKRSRKLISILLTLALLATLLVPLATPAAAASTYSVSYTPTISPNMKGVTTGLTALGTITITVDAASAVDLNGKSFWLELPSDFEFRNGSDARFTDDSVIDATYYEVVASGTDYAFNAPANGKVDVKSYNNGNKFFIKVNAAAENANKPLVIYLKSLRLFVPSGAADGPVTATAVASSSSVFSSGKFDIAKIGSSSIQVSVGSVGTIGPDGDKVTLYIKELSKGAMATKAKTLKFTLPTGYKWDTTGASAEIYWNAGTALAADIPGLLSTENDGRTLLIDNSTAKTLSGSYFKLKVKVDPDENIAKVGSDVEVTLGGESTVTPSSLIVAKYGDYGIKVAAVGDPEEVLAGRTAQEIGDFAIEELIASSLPAKRSITATLIGAKWSKAPTLDTTSSSNSGEAIISGKTWTIGGTYSDQITLTLGDTYSSNAVKAVFEKGEINVSPNVTGDIKLVFSGSAGVTGEVVVAKVVAPVTASIEGQVTNLAIGTQGQALPDIVVAETKKEAIDATVGKNTLMLEFPLDVTPSMPAKVEVVEGDITLDMNSIARGVSADGRWNISVTVKSTSVKPSKIKFSGIKATLARTVPEGSLNVAVKGTALVQTTTDFPGYTSAAVVKVGNVVTSVTGDTKYKSTFKIGDSKFVLNGVDVTMDVAPYIKDGRTYLPLRYVAQSLGVADANILWDQATKKVTLIKGTTFVQLTIGSNIMMVNGMPITMDVAPEISSDRTCLPIRFVAQVLGATVGWDEATQTVSLN